jgi:hypothetical protein
MKKSKKPDIDKLLSEGNFLLHIKKKKKGGLILTVPADKVEIN